jgi:cytochrome c-type biogenesis protein
LLAKYWPLLAMTALALLLAMAGEVSAGDKAPEVTLKDLDGQSFNISDYRGSVLLLDFMSLSCVPCRDLAHELKELDEENIERFFILSIDIQPEVDPSDDVRSYKESNGYEWRFSFDSDDHEALVAYGAREIPLIVIINPLGDITFSEKGRHSKEEMEAEVKKAFDIDEEFAPDVDLVATDGGTFSLSSRYSKEVVVLHLMELDDRDSEYQNDQLKELLDEEYENVQFISVDVSEGGVNLTELQAYADSGGYSWTFASDNTVRDAFWGFNHTQTPQVVIIDKGGLIREDHLGRVNSKQLAKDIENLLPEKGTTLGLLLAIGLALIAAVTCYFSPCSFPLLPGYIAYYFKQTSQDLADKGADAAEEAGIKGRVGKGLKLGSLSGLGLVLVYSIFGVVFLVLVTTIGAFSSSDLFIYMQLAIGIVLVVLGAITVSDLPVDTSRLTNPIRRLFERGSGGGPKKHSFTRKGLFIYGLGYGSASLACSFPVFVALFFATFAIGLGPSIIVFIVFLIGLWALMAGITTLLSLSEKKAKVFLTKHMITIKRFAGVVFIIAGAYFVYEFLAAQGII